MQWVDARNDVGMHQQTAPIPFGIPQILGKISHFHHNTHFFMVLLFFFFLVQKVLA